MKKVSSNRIADEVIKEEKEEEEDDQ